MHPVSKGDEIAYSFLPKWISESNGLPGAGFHTVFDLQGTLSRTTAKRAKKSNRCPSLVYPLHPDKPTTLLANLSMTLGVERFLAVRPSEGSKPMDLVNKLLTRRELYGLTCLPSTTNLQPNGISGKNKSFVLASKSDLLGGNLRTSGQQLGSQSNWQGDKKVCPAQRMMTRSLLSMD